MANLSLRHIYKVYPNGVKAVNDFNMDIEDKEFIVFVGPSGCGKSTTLRMIAGLEDISAGELRIGDMVVNDVEPKDRDIAMVFQNYALYPHMSVYENIAFGLRIRKMPNEEIHKRVTEAAEILGITEYLDRKPKEMSGGQRQRVSLGRAIVREPKVMLLDEPLSNLDAKLRTQMRAEISKLHKKLQTTFIYVTHDQVEAMTMGTRIVVMKNGFVQQIDTPQNLYRYPGNKFVAGFIGTPQMNFFEGTLTKNGNKVDIKFEYSDAMITVPYEKLLKARPHYLDGKHPVYIGLRAEDASLDPEVVANSKYKVKVVISHIEELGNESLVYADINMHGDGYTESSTRIIIKSQTANQYTPGEVYDCALDVDHLHLFDKETEESIIPRIPEVNEIECKVKDGKLAFLNSLLQLPSAITCPEGKGTMLLPTNAIVFGGRATANAVECEEIGGKYLVSLDVAGRRLFAVSEKPVKLGECNISIDMKRISLHIEDTVVEAMNEKVAFNGTFDKQKVVEDVAIFKKPKKDKKQAEEVVAEQATDEQSVAEQVEQQLEEGEQPEVVKYKKRKVIHFYLNIAGTRFDAPDDIAQKIFATLPPRTVFSTPFRYEFTPYDFTLADSGIPAKVERVLDYGNEKFAVVRIDENTVINVFVKDNVWGDVYLQPDISKVGVVETVRDIRLA